MGKAKPFDTGRHGLANAPLIVGVMIAAMLGPRLWPRGAKCVGPSGAALVLSSGLAPAGPRPQTNLFGQFAALFGIVRRDHRIIRGQPPTLPVFLR